MQVRYVTAYTFDAKYLGEFETVIECVASPGYAKLNGKFNAKRWIFKWINGERGFLSVSGTNNTLGYNVKRERYWLNPLGNINLFADWNWGQEKEIEELEFKLQNID